MRHARSAAAFTILELLVVLTIFAVVATLVGMRTSSFSFWQEEAAIRKLSETITFLHAQAVADQAYYEIEFDLEAASYRVGAIRPDEDVEQSLSELALDAGNLSLELAAFLNPSVGETHTIIPPPSFPSLAEPVELPAGMTISDIRTPRGLHEKPNAEERIYLLFSPRGFSEFGVIHLRLIGGSPVTVLVNPFTGTTQIFRDHRDFEWTWGRNADESA